MKPAPFKYVEAPNEAALIGALSQYGGEAQLLAGGQSLVPMMNFRIVTPSVLIDINPIAPLSHITLSSGELVVGSLTRHAMVEDSAEVAEHCPLLHEAIRHVAHRAVRNRGTFGGSLALAYPGAEIPLALATLGADILLNSPRGERRVAAHEFLRGALDTALDDDEYIKSATIPLSPSSASACFVEVSRRHGDFALAAAAVVVDLGAGGKVDFLRAAVSGGTGAPLRLAGLEKQLTGVEPDTTSLKDLADDAIARVEVVGDHHYPEDYRRYLLRGALAKALGDALARAERRHAQ
jgi:carbon-monoxide dehydrogenase medium subunit